MVRSSTYFFLFLFLIACSNSSNQSVVNGEAFGTTWQIKFYKNTTDFKDQELELKITNELERIDSIFSLYDKNSTISQINQDQSLQWNRSIGYEDFSKLIEISGGKVAGFIFVINLFDLPGNDLLTKKGYKTEFLVKFPGH